MAIALYNTLTRTVEPLAPLVPGQVGMYVCGLTPYDDCHIGHLMGPTLFDAVARWLRARGLRVRFVNNVTDIDDKIINRAAADGVPWQEIAERYTAQYNDLLARLNVTTITDRPRCTEYIPQMTAYIADLVARGRAYVAADGVYYDVQKQPGYGKLSGRKLDDMLAGARIDRDAQLRHPGDFALWKLAKPGEPSWASPWGAGRPGWHIECSVMASAILGREFDIHGGGDDLKFPHHENEIAQSEAHGEAYAHVWMHNGLVQYEGTKVGKSDPRMKEASFKNQFVAKLLIGEHGPATVRYLFLCGHYRRPIDFAPRNLTEKRTALAKLHRLLGGLMGEGGEPSLDEILARPLAADAAAARAAFVAAMDDDFNTAAAIAQLFTLVRIAGKQGEGEGRETLRALRDLGRIIGLFLAGDETRMGEDQHAAHGDAAVDGVIDLLVQERLQARAAKDFAGADRIRDQLARLGVALSDKADGSAWQSPKRSADLLPALMALVLEMRQAARANRQFAASDRIRDALGRAGITVKDGKDGATWQVG
ncbi:MAG TPA: cysteine--tRNA ligase [Planctomycetota bacterium]|nr:cysteine--tRNA ligase [Planctomycetota bacterium]